MKKMLITGLAAIGVAGMISGGTFALWSDFQVLADSSAEAGELVLTADESSVTTNGGGGPLAPGENKTVYRYVTNRSDSTVALQDALLELSFENLRDAENGCASNGEAVAEGASESEAAGGDYTNARCDTETTTGGELSQEAYLQVRKGAPSTSISDASDCVSGSSSAVGAAKTLAAWMSAPAVNLGTLDPGEGLCIVFEFGLPGDGIDPPGIDFGGPAATNASQGDSALWDIRLDLTQQ